MILKEIQNNLQRLYQLEVDQNVEDFLTGEGDTGKETLWIRNNGKELQIALFIDPAILQKLKRQNPFRQINGKNLNAFLIAVEGVSHFVYFLKKAVAKKPVTRLEMELQAEVDKYLLCVFLFFQQEGKVPSFLFAALFENIRLASDLYQEANRLASKFCARLDRDYLRTHRWPKVLEKARHFYNLDHWAKIAQLMP